MNNYAEALEEDEDDEEYKDDSALFQSGRISNLVKFCTIEISSFFAVAI